MAYQQIPGRGAWLGLEGNEFVITSGFNSSLIDATGEKFAMVGLVWFAEKTGTKDIRRVGFRFGTVTKAGGSALTVSLQNPSTTTGPPGQPDETQDQTVAIANADASFASNTWYRTGTLSADRTVSFGEDLAIVIEYDGAGRLSSDAVNFSTLSRSVAQVPTMTSLKTASWAGTNNMPVCVLEFTDGTFGTLDMSMPASTIGNVSLNTGSTPDEIALPIYLPYKCKVDGLYAGVFTNANTQDFDLVLYQGTTALQTCSIDANRFTSNTSRPIYGVIPETELLANTQYYLAVKPTTANNIIIYYANVSDANHLSVWPGGVNFNYTTRVDAGSWAAHTTTRRLLAGIRISSIDDGAGGGTTIAGTPMLRGMV